MEDGVLTHHIHKHTKHSELLSFEGAHEFIHFSNKGSFISFSSLFTSASRNSSLEGLGVKSGGLPLELP